MENPDHPPEADDVDVQGERLLAAPLRSVVPFGTRIELTGTVDADGLQPGDRCIVTEIVDTGDIVVAWERGFASEINPDTTPFQPIAA